MAHNRITGCQTIADSFIWSFYPLIRIPINCYRDLNSLWLIVPFTSREIRIRDVLFPKRYERPSLRRALLPVRSFLIRPNDSPSFNCSIAQSNRSAFRAAVAGGGSSPVSILFMVLTSLWPYFTCLLVMPFLGTPCSLNILSLRLREWFC